ncbi:hypothetical protein B0T16DRAFT_460943 [Cercophora newfieldiana]|uniref:HORMA domain-containing protein n=1 Tax=Cercophora newfieldiana TaxID=92897 RepID=A0AA39XWB5_9PEZI|nr:hypothetical protein B0T16DRAFT_460943 [Cercophora newfieldiana]
MPKAHRPQKAPSAVGRDARLCKAVLTAAASQILYARHGFAPYDFRSVPLLDLFSQTFENLLCSGEPIDKYDSEKLREQGSTVLLRGDSKDYNVKTFLGMLATDIFSLIEREELVKFRISFLRSQTLEADNLIEYYTIVLKYNAEGNYGIDVWRAGTDEQQISNSRFMLWNLGDYLSRLPRLKGPVYCTLSFHSSGRPADPLIGTWGYDHSDFDAAKLQLQQRPRYAFQRIACLVVGPPKDESYSRRSPATEDSDSDDGASRNRDAEDATPEDMVSRDMTPENAASGDMASVIVAWEDAASVIVVSEDAASVVTMPRETKMENTHMEDMAMEDDRTQESIEVATSEHSAEAAYEFPSGSDTPLSKPPSKKRQTGTKGKEKTKAKAAIAKPNRKDKPASRPRPPSPSTTTSLDAISTTVKGRKSLKGATTKANNTQMQEVIPEKPKKVALKPKRKAKQPLQLYSDPASDLPETQDAVPESHPKVQSANPSKRQRDEGTEAPVHRKTKRLQPAVEPSSGQFAQIDGIPNTTSSELSSLDMTSEKGTQGVRSGSNEDGVEASTVSQANAQASTTTQPIALSQKSRLIDDMVLTSDLEEQDEEKMKDKLVSGVEISSDGVEGEYNEDEEEDGVEEEDEEADDEHDYEEEE